MKKSLKKKHKTSNKKTQRVTTKNQFFLLLGLFIVAGFIVLAFSVSKGTIKDTQGLASFSPFAQKNQESTITKISCDSIADCGPNSYCLDKICVRCITNSDCTYPKTCQPDHSCK